MSEAKKTRAMTERGFLHKASGKVSAIAFLTTHREWLLSGELAPLTSPILVKLDRKEILPTPALESIKGLLLSHMMAKQASKAEDAILNPKEAPAPKPWMATIYNGKGEVQTRIKEDGEEETLQKGFEHASEADRWSDRRLFDGASDWFSVVSHTTILNGEGEPLSTIIMRDDAIGRMLKAPKGAVCKPQSKTTGKLSFGVKVTNDRAVFSKG